MAQQTLSARELAARGFAAARGAVASLHPSLVDDADLIPISAEDQERVGARAAELASAISMLDQVAALLSAQETGQIAAAVAGQLVVFDDAFQSAVSNAKGIHLSMPPAFHDLVEQHWAQALPPLRAARQALLGYSAASASEEAGTPLGGLLQALADAIGRAGEVHHGAGLPTQRTPRLASGSDSVESGPT